MGDVSRLIAGPATRYLLFTGKGGVGKTTLACATAVALADAGARVLLVSTDPASNLDEVLATPLGPDPRPVTGCAGLDALNLDPGEAARRHRERMVGPYRGVLPAAAIAQIEEQLSGACTTEVAAFNEFARLIGDPAAISAYDHVVLDTAPTGHTLRLIELPAAWESFIETNTSGSSCLGPLAGLGPQRALYQGAVSNLRDPTLTTVVLVARADRASLREAARAAGELRGQGLGAQRLVLNARLADPGPGGDPIARRLAELGAAAVAQLPAPLTNLARVDLPFRPADAVGLDRIRAIVSPPTLSPSAGEASPSLGPATDLPGLDALIARLAGSERGAVLVLGKGGVGKTTLAAKLAAELAALGHPVHLSTTDPADHISGRFFAPMPGLTVSAIRAEDETRRHVEHVLATSGARLSEPARALLEEELRSPCIEEIAVFTAFARTVAAAESGFVILDTAPTGHTLLLLDTTEAYHREVGRTGEALPIEVRSLLPRLRDPEYTRVLIVTLAEATPVHEAAALQEDLRRAGIEPFAWVVNRTLIGLDTADRTLRRKAAGEAALLEEVRSRHARRVYSVPLNIDETA